MNSIKKYLFQPFPCEKNTWKIIIFISLFITLFILTFQPFGLNDLRQEYKFFILSGYGVVTFIILIIDLLLLPALIPKNFEDEKWTVLKELLFLLWILFTVGLGNLLYSHWTMGFRLSFMNILIFQAYTVAIGIIPVTALTFIQQNYLKRKNEETAEHISSSLIKLEEINGTIHKVSFSSENEREILDINVKELIFVKSEGNYITIGYYRNDRLLKSLLRNKLKYAADLLGSFPYIFQCHRSWLININRITKISGNSQGLRLLMEGFDEEIPVARKQAADFRRQITMNKE